MILYHIFFKISTLFTKFSAFFMQKFTAKNIISPTESGGDNNYLCFQIVPVTVTVTTPGTVAKAPVTGSRVNAAAGTVNAPAVVANSPVVSL